MPITHVTEAGDPRLIPYCGLRDGVLRRYGDQPPTSGHPGGASLFLAESEGIVRRAVLVGHRVVSVLADASSAQRLAEVLPPTVEVLIAPAELIAAVSGLGVHRGALALVARPAVRTVADLVADARRVVVLERVSNPVNIGLIARSAAGLGCDALLLDAQSADPLYRRAVRASMGATLSLPWARADTATGLVEALNGAGFRTVALTLTAGSLPLRSVGTHERTALVLGSEGNGLSLAAEQACTVRATIPMRASTGVDSLNVSAAAAIACFSLFAPPQ